MKMPQLWVQARDYAIRRGFDQDAEDFAQIAYLKLKRGRATTFGNLFTDYLRERYGAKGRIKDPYKSVELLNYVGLDQIPEGATVEKFERSRLMELADLLELDQRAIYVLRYLWGFSEKEIGYCFGISHSAISLRLKNIQKLLTKRARVSYGKK